MIDPISDMLTRIRNAYTAGHEEVVIPHSGIKEEIVKILAKEGYIDSYSLKKSTPGNQIQLKLLYKGKLPIIDGIVRISKPGRRIYADSNRIPHTLGGFGITILSTNKGIMTDKQARKEKIGGEVLCKVW